MALTGRLFLKPIRAHLTAIPTPSSPLSRSRIPLFGKFEPLKAWAKGLEPMLVNNVRNPHWKLCIQRFYTSNFFKSGSKIGMGGVFGGPVLFGSICFGPHAAYAMNEFDILGDDHHLDLSDADEDPHNFLVLARKLLLPVFLVITLLMNWDHPVILATKVILILVGTKPTPFSVYLLIEQLRHQYIHQHPILCKFKSLYAKKVEVEDYIFLCVAQVELIDQKFTVIGILGSWWVLPWSSCQAAFTELRNKILRNYVRN